MTIRIELFTAPGCRRCARAAPGLRALAVQVLGEDRLEWREVNVLREIEHAVSLGVRRVPAIAVDGRLCCPALPDRKRWRALLADLESD